MTSKWVGWIGWTACLALLAASVATANTPGEYHERFWDDDVDWIAVSGDVQVNHTHGSGGRLLDYLQIDGDGSGALSFARAHVDPAVVNTTFQGYQVVAVVERDPDYDGAPGGPGWFGITFGEAAGEYYLAGFDTDNFFVASANGDTLTTVYEQTLTAADWSQVPNVPQERQDDGVDQRLRYTLLVQGTTLIAKINGWTLATAELPTTANGHFGFAADTGTSIHVQEVIYRVHDVTAPHVDLFRPDGDTLYLNDVSVPGTVTGGVAVVVGEITLGAEVLDTESGIDHALLYLDGEYLPGSRTTDTGVETMWTIDTTGLDTGYHQITVRATDKAGNVAEDQAAFLVVSPEASTKTVADAVDTLGNLLP